MNLSEEVIELLTGEETIRRVLAAYAEMEANGIGISEERWEAKKRELERASNEILLNVGEEDFRSFEETIRAKVDGDPRIERSGRGRARNLTEVVGRRTEGIYGQFLDLRRMRTLSSAMLTAESSLSGEGPDYRAAYEHSRGLGNRFSVIDGFKYDVFSYAQGHLFSPCVSGAVLRRVSLRLLEVKVAAVLSGDSAFIEAARDRSFFDVLVARTGGGDAKFREAVKWRFYSTLYGMSKEEPAGGYFPDYAKWVRGVNGMADPESMFGTFDWNLMSWKRGLRVAVVMKSVVNYVVRYLVAELYRAQGGYRIWGVGYDEIYIEDWGGSEDQIKATAKEALGKLKGMNMEAEEGLEWIPRKVREEGE